MDSSLGFGSARRDSFALFRLGFPAASSIDLTSPRQATRWLIMQKVRGHLAAPTVCKHSVSGSISLPFRGTFHLSFTVLVHYRSSGST